MSLAGAEIRAILASLGLDAGESLGEQLAVYLALLLRWNARMNLTAIREPGQMVRRHFAESLLVAREVPATAATMLDFGSGAGIPGIPVALARPELSVTLAESQSKKASFLREAVRALAIKADVWAQRVEQMPQSRRFDVVAMRAVDKMDQAMPAAAARVSPGGSWMILTSLAAEEQVRSVAGGVAWQSLPLPNLSSGVLLAARLGSVERSR
jgi:16S rRNA (guanine527-N7)-methyltransferase